MEELQNRLTQENFRMERINGELEAANMQLIDARETEDSLNALIDDLKVELARRQLPSVSGANTPGEPKIFANVADNAFAAAPLPSPYETLRDVRFQNNFY